MWLEDSVHSTPLLCRPHMGSNPLLDSGYTIIPGSWSFSWSYYKSSICSCSHIFYDSHCWLNIISFVLLHNEFNNFVIVRFFLIFHIQLYYNQYFKWYFYWDILLKLMHKSRNSQSKGMKITVRDTFYHSIWEVYISYNVTNNEWMDTHNHLVITEY